MKLEIYKEAANIWKQAASQSTADELKVELELYKRLMGLLQVGNYYYFIFNFTKNNLEFVSDDCEKLMGYSKAEYDIPFLLDKIHPDDLPYMLNHENKGAEFLAQLPVDKLFKYKLMHDYRVRQQNGNYLRLLQQGVVIEHDENGGVLRTLIVHTDITHLKPEGKPGLSFIGLEGEPSLINIEAKKIYPVNSGLLTKREKEVLKLLIDGKLSKEISVALNISKQTVDRHRKNMIEKNKVSNTGELIAKAITHGWL